MHHLVNCPECARHVRSHEPRCPFCNGAMPANAAAVTRTAPAGARLSRAALFALGAASALAACSGSSANQPPPESSPTGVSQPTASPTAANTTTPANTSPAPTQPDGTRVMMRYGAPPAPLEGEEV